MCATKCHMYGLHRAPLEFGFARGGGAPRELGAKEGRMNGWVLVVDDETVSRNALKRVFEHGGWRAITAASMREALASAATHRFDLVLLDLYLQEGTALPWIAPLREAQPGVPVVVVTARGCIG